MRISQDLIDIETTGNDSDVAFSLPPEALAKLADMMIEKRYASPYRCLHELTANAVDAGGPVTVKLPTRFDPTLIVTDGGEGMSDEFMRTKFTAFFTSTKSDSDEKIGGYGTGRLSALRMSKSFVIRTTNAGMTGHYKCYVGENKLPCLRRLSLVPAQPGEVGTIVQVPVPAEHVEPLVKEARNLLFYENVDLTITGARIEPLDWKIRGEKWGFLVNDKYNSPLRLVMGGYVYPVDPDRLPYGVRTLSGAVLFAEVGDADPTETREGLRYTEKTVATIKRLMNLALDEVKELAQAEIDAQPDLFQARQKGFGFKSTRFLSQADFTYKGEPLTYMVAFTVDNSVFDTSKSRSDGPFLNLKSENCTRVRVEEFSRRNVTVYRTDPSVRNPSQRIKNALKPNDYVILLKGDLTPAQLAEFDGVEIKSVAELPDVSRVARTRMKGSARMLSRDVYDSQWINIHPRSGINPNPQDGDLYLPVSNFDFADPDHKEFVNLDLVRSMRKGRNVYGTPKSWGDNPEGLVHLQDYVKEELEKILAEYDLAYLDNLHTILAEQVPTSLYGLFRILKSRDLDRKLIKLRYLAKVWDEADVLPHARIRTYLETAKFLGIEVTTAKKAPDLKDYCEGIMRRYPLIPVLNEARYLGLEQLELIVDYLNS